MRTYTLRQRLAAGLLAVTAWAVSACGQQEAGAPSPSGGAASASSPAVTAPAAPADSARPSTATPAAAGPSEPPAVADKSGQPSGPSGAVETAATPSAPAKPSAASPAPKASPSRSPSATPSQTPSSPPAAPAKEAEAAHTVSISVTGNGEWGKIVALEQTELKEDDTVASLLVRTLKAHKLAYDTTGSGAMFYVRGIDGLSEFDDGPMSGWHYRVNGKEPGVGAGSFKPEPGDSIEWIYESGEPAAKEDQGKAP